MLLLRLIYLRAAAIMLRIMVHFIGLLWLAGVRSPSWGGAEADAKAYLHAMTKMQTIVPLKVVTLTGECTFIICESLSNGALPQTVARNLSLALVGPEWVASAPSGKVLHVTGDYAGWNGWFHNNFGHTIHDHLPALSWLFQNTNSTVLVLGAPLTRELVRCTFGDLANRIMWVQYNTVVVVTGSLTVLPVRGKGYHPLRYSPEFRSALHHQLATASTCKMHPRTTALNVIYYSRTSGKTFHGREMDRGNEAAVLVAIKRAMHQWGVVGELIVFNGMRADGTPLSIEEQIQLFSSAKIVVGPHGSGLANIAWMDWSGQTHPTVLEFICTPKSVNVQRFCPWEKTYYNLFAAPAPLDYHHIGFTNQSTSATTLVNLAELSSTLERIMNPVPAGLRYMTRATADFVPFFWHIPKAAGTFVGSVFDKGYELKPQASVGTPVQLRMLVQRMLSVPASWHDHQGARTKCALIRHARQTTVWSNDRWESCIAKLSLSLPEHRCLPGCFGFMQTPLLYGAAQVFALTTKAARVATVLREPVSRFVSEFSYLKTATWESTYNPTIQTIDQFVAVGNYQRNWMVCTLADCKGATTDADLEVAKSVIGHMLVGFTDDMVGFFDRLEDYWQLSEAVRKKARASPQMKGKANANNKKDGDQLSVGAEATLRTHLHHDIALYQFAKKMRV